MIRRNVRLGFIIINCIFLLGSSTIAIADSRPVPKVDADPITKVRVNQTNTLIGQVVATEGGLIASEIAGKIQSVAVKVGDQVKAGDPLVQIETTKLKLEKELAIAKVKIGEAKVAQARLEYKQTQIELNRQEELRASPAFAKALHEDLENAQATAESTLAAIKADLAKQKTDLEIADFNLERATIRAPYPGIVEKKLVHPGAYISPGNAVVILVNDQSLEIELNLPKELKNAVNATKEVQIQLNIDDNKLYPAKLRKIVLSENTASRTLTARFIPVPPKPNLIAKQAVTVLVPTTEVKTALTMHKDALLQKNGAFYVFVIRGEQAVVQPVEIGEAIADRLEILRGLKIDDLVVIRGNERLIPGQKVNYEIKVQKIKLEDEANVSTIRE